jgi:hypothetical protein
MLYGNEYLFEMCDIEFVGTVKISVCKTVTESYLAQTVCKYINGVIWCFKLETNSATSVAF